jgi:polyisoprenoid-binding protein YceI
MVMRTFFAAIPVTAALLLCSTAHAQQATRLELLPESRVRVDGTSNREDWTVDAAELRGFAVVHRDGAAVRITEAGFTVPARRMVSEHGVIMDRLMHGALKAAAHPDIVYELTTAATLPNGGTATMTTTGRVRIAGVTRAVEAPVQAEWLENGSIRFTGSHPLLMSDFGITPPTAMFGALRTGNRVVVHFELVVRP